MKVHVTRHLRSPGAKAAVYLAMAALLIVGAPATKASDFGQGRGATMDEPVRDWGSAPGPTMDPFGSNNRFGELGSPGLERQSRFQGPGRHRVSGFGQAPSGTPGRFVHGPGSGGRGR